MKHEWRKHEKNLYVPKQKPEIVNVPVFQFFSIEGAGNPNDEFFGNCIEVLYALSYAVKMSPKKGKTPEGYFDYTVYPLEGVWDIADEAKKTYNGKIDKNTLQFNLMIRQPNFVTADFAHKIIAETQKKSPNELLHKVKFETIEDGKCVQMLHHGSYDNEPQSFALMKSFCEQQKLERISMKHREIYLSDARKTSPEKLQTILRYWVK